MNPLGGLIALLGLAILVIGITGSQRSVMGALRGARPSAMPTGGTAPGSLILPSTAPKPPTPPKPVTT